MKKVILIAYNINPNGVSEALVAIEWLKIIEKYYLVDVITDARHRENLLNHQCENTTFHFIEGTYPWRMLEQYTGIKGVAPAMFYRKLKRKLLHKDLSNISLIHCLTPAGVFFYNDIFKLGIPVLIGPLGGGLPTPKYFTRAFHLQLIGNLTRDYLYRQIASSHGWLRYLTNAKRIIVGTEYVKEKIPKALHSRCVTIFDTVVDPKVFTPPPTISRNSVVRVLYAGRLVSSKGPILLLEAVRGCLRQGLRGFTVEIAGRGPLHRKLQKLINQYQLQDVVSLLGKLPREGLLKKYQTSDVFCLPTLREPGGTVILEAMACGLPIITSNYGGPGDVVTEQCGIKIELQNYETYVDDLSKALTRLVTNAELRSSMGRASRMRVEQEYSIRALEGKILDLYQGLVVDLN